MEKIPSLVRELLSFDPRELSLYEYFREAQRRTTPVRSVVLVQCVEDLYYLALFGQIVSSLRERKSVRVEQFVFRSLTPGESRSLWSFLKRRLITNSLSGRKWVRLYGSFSDGVAYYSTSYRPFADAIDLCRAWGCWRNLRDRKALVDLVIEEVPVGDLVNDSFLRFKPASTIDLQDIYVWIVLWQVYRDIRRAKAYFSRVRPALYLTSYSTYIQHGIAARVALQHGVRVFSFGNYQEFAKELSVGDWLHVKTADAYADGFANLSGSEEKLAMAESALSARMAGTIDSATAYMRRSAYALSTESVPDVRGAVVVFLHDFYDSPHGYLDMVFPDFWLWICFTIETLRAAKIPFFLKRHPNQILLNDDVLADLKNRYPDVSIISANITNKQLAEAGMVCGVTVFGTVAHEMAYLGVPTIGCARHPHISFEFCRTARTTEEYAEILRRYREIKIGRTQMRLQSLAFYYMHNLNMEEKDHLLRKLSSDLRRLCAGNAGMEPDLNGVLRQMAELPAYAEHISEWSRIVS